MTEVMQQSDFRSAQRVSYHTVSHGGVGLSFWFAFLTIVLPYVDPENPVHPASLQTLGTRCLPSEKISGARGAHCMPARNDKRMDWLFITGKLPKEFVL